MFTELRGENRKLRFDEDRLKMQTETDPPTTTRETSREKLQTAHENYTQTSLKAW